MERILEDIQLLTVRKLEKKNKKRRNMIKREIKSKMMRRKKGKRTKTVIILV